MTWHTLFLILVFNMSKLGGKRLFVTYVMHVFVLRTREPPYPQSMFWSKNKKNMYTPTYPTLFYYMKVGYKGVFMMRTCFPDGDEQCA